ncbi:MAG: hypothetical protein UU14_C0023G0004 [Candidatus Roizmanbacteria bacterium GW2011_GWB1_40_7]|uniref:Uncharacterized protein n=2 Tax=Candidatus Roizmaniibacteriota TaxID=1752723 RepID=A0A0G0T3P9_9BACT|nr:MAG: hypothetical protein UT85_C0041G0010 [Candidatus Levybacteria bacterium GW2011_GWA2_40_16]KKR71604.1 MAG: hypothetical protein UU14_C0023G0004 [Candidatus Roizmanbacteria bacterium GW2011_GWB1_40_7]KKR90900.1 MAG: hypothetical protein UU41_C0053G0004 [Candidatus Roizmanbacteria bacterium GW2011_GWA1_41_13]
MITIRKPQQTDTSQIKKILTQWTNVDEADKYTKRITHEINGKTEFNTQFWTGVMTI